MKTVEQVKMDLSIATGSLLGHIESFPENVFYKKPTPESWSAAEITEHLCIIEGFTIDLLNGNTEQPKRAPDTQVDFIATAFGNTDKKYNAPDMILPQGNDLKKEELLVRMKRQRNDMFEIAGSMNLTLLCTDFTHQAFGMLTGIEWIYFTIYHGDRHLHQLLKTAQALNAMEPA
jgi:hypothetical protein